MYRTALSLLLLIAFTPAVHSQPDAESAADSLVHGDERLFEDFPWTPDSSLLESETSPTQSWLRSHRDPLLSFRFERRDLLGLRDRQFPISYDRSDGLYLGIGADSPLRFFLERRTQAYLGFGYGFGSHYWQVVGGLRHDFFSRETPLRFGAEGHIITDTRDAWKMNSIENSLFAALAGVDTRNYFKRNGFLFSLEQFLTPRTEVKVEFRRDNYLNAQRETGWSLFGPKQPFQEVLPIREGWMNSLAVSLLADYITFRTWGNPQVGLEAESEFGFGDYSFQEHVVDLHLKGTLIPRTLWLALHARAGTATGDAPPQRLFTIGGFGTLPGFPQNQYIGNRMVLLQTDVLFSPFDGLLRDIRIILSNDIGAVSTTGTTSDLFGGFPDALSQFKYSTGIYLGPAAATSRIGVAWRTDVYAEPTFVIRLGQRF
jgi:hypothetical protein